VVGGRECSDVGGDKAHSLQWQDAEGAITAKEREKGQNKRATVQKQRFGVQASVFGRPSGSGSRVLF
jgi:hypothetical protein